MAGVDAGATSKSTFVPTEVDLRLQSMMATKKGRDKLKTMVRGGVPPELRPRVWHFLAGASTKRSSQLDVHYYQRLLESVDAAEARDQTLRASSAASMSSSSGGSTSGGP